LKESDLNPTAKDYISKFYRNMKEWPEIQDIVQTCHCSPQDAEEWLKRCQGSVKAARVREPKKWRFPSMEELVIRFASKLQYFGFIVATIVDVGMAWFFLYSLGSGDLAKIMLGSMGLVLTAAKTWGWAYANIDKKALPVAIFAVALSIFGNTAILRAEFELQAKSAISTNTEQTSKQSPLDVINGQITDKQAELKKKTTARDTIDLTVETNLPMYNTLDGKVKQANKELKELTDRMAEVQKTPVIAEKEVVKSEIVLDAWSVFRQWTELDFSDKPRTLAYFFALLFACLPELVIFATTPRKTLVKRRVKQ
jgi:hypothetical protein